MMKNGAQSGGCEERHRDYDEVILRTRLDYETNQWPEHNPCVFDRTCMNMLEHDRTCVLSSLFMFVCEMLSVR